MLAIFVLMMVLSAGRPIGLNIPAADDFVSWCMAAMAFLGLAHTFRSRRDDPGRSSDRQAAGEEPALDRARLPGHRHRLYRFLRVLRLQLIRDSWRFHEMSQGVIAIPMWIPQIGYAAGLVILLIAFVDEFIHVLRGNLAALRKAQAEDRRRGRRAAPCRAGSRRGASIEIALLLLVLLTALLWPGGVWIAHRADGLRLCRHDVRRRQRAARRGAGDDRLGQQRVVDACGAAAVHLDGRDSVPHAGCRRKCSAGWRPGSTVFPAG